MEEPFSREEIKSVLRTLPKNRSAGPSGFFYEHWVQAEPFIGPDLVEFFNKILTEGRFPAS